jgi:hypothetical protein
MVPAARLSAIVAFCGEDNCRVNVSAISLKLSPTIV